MKRNMTAYYITSFAYLQLQPVLSNGPAGCPHSWVSVGRTEAEQQTLTAHSQGSLKGNLPASAFTAETATLQRQDGRQLEERGETRRKTDRNTDRQTDRREEASPLAPLEQSLGELNLSPDRPSGCLTTFPCPLCWLHASFPPPSPAPTSDLLSLSSPTPPIHPSSAPPSSHFLTLLLLPIFWLGACMQSQALLSECLWRSEKSSAVQVEGEDVWCFRTTAPPPTSRKCSIHKQSLLCWWSPFWRQHLRQYLGRAALLITR